MTPVAVLHPFYFKPQKGIPEGMPFWGLPAIPIPVAAADIPTLRAIFAGDWPR